jgi:methionyl-tRNA formyltransferase
VQRVIIVQLVLLTTETSHHAYFVKELVAANSIAGVIIETSLIKAPFDSNHSFEKARDSYERERFFGGNDVPIKNIFEDAVQLPELNTAPAISLVSRMGADVFIAFGTGKLGADFIKGCGAPIINLHGGDPERYRGLDTHLWSIYHGDFSGLITTIHRLNRRLDDGEIILQSAVPLWRGMGLHELRASNTITCVDLALGALDIFRRKRDFISHPQRKKGRYYSFMPACLKEVCVQKFNRYTEALS